MKNYRMLIGRLFVVGEDTYTICEITREGSRLLVEAVDSRAGTEQAQSVRFPLDRVVQSLLIDEEIELYQPTFLGVSGAV